MIRQVVDTSTCGGSGLHTSSDVGRSTCYHHPCRLHDRTMNTNALPFRHFHGALKDDYFFFFFSLCLFSEVHSEWRSRYRPTLGLNACLESLRQGLLNGIALFLGGSFSFPISCFWLFFIIYTSVLPIHREGSTSLSTGDIAQL